MATCPKCLHQNANDPAVIFCQSCGARLPGNTEPGDLQPRLERAGQAANRAANSIMSFQFWALILLLIIACLVIGVNVR